MTLIRIDHHPSRRQLNVFGAIWLVFFGVFGAVMLSRGSPAPAAALWGLAVIVPLVGRLAPPVMRIVYLGMACAALPIGVAVSFLILALVYYLVLTPTGLVMRVFGYDPMRHRFDPGATTYWRPRDRDDSPERYFRQF